MGNTHTEVVHLDISGKSLAQNTQKVWCKQRSGRMDNRREGVLNPLPLVVMMMTMKAGTNDYQHQKTGPL